MEDKDQVVSQKTDDKMDGFLIWFGVGDLLLRPCYIFVKGGGWMEEVIKAVVIGILTLVIAAIKQDDGD